MADEPRTVAWLALRAGPSSFAIVDVFPDADGRQTHLAGAVAAALTEKAGELLARRPQIEPVDVVAAKPGYRRARIRTATRKADWK